MVGRGGGGVKRAPITPLDSKSRIQASFDGRFARLGLEWRNAGASR